MFLHAEEASGAVGILHDDGHFRLGVGLGVSHWLRLRFGTWLDGALGFGRRGGVRLDVFLEIAEFAVEGSFVGGFVAEMKSVGFVLLGSPVETGGAGCGVEEYVESALAAAAMPFGFGDFEDHRADGGAVKETGGAFAVTEGGWLGIAAGAGIAGFGWSVAFAPLLEDEEPFVFGFVVEKMGAGASSVF